MTVCFSASTSEAGEMTLGWHCWTSVVIVVLSVRAESGTKISSIWSIVGVADICFVVVQYNIAAPEKKIYIRRQRVKDFRELVHYFIF